MDNKAEHSFNGIECTKGHTGKPQCKQCEVCGWVEYPYDKPCKDKNVHVM